MNTNIELAAMYDRAAELIDELGWAQDRLRDDFGHICAAMAVDLARHEHSVVSAGYMYIPFRKHMVPQNLVEYNDQPGMTKEQVTTALRLVAEYLRRDAE